MDKRVFKINKPKNLKTYQILDVKEEFKGTNWKTPELLKYEKLRKTKKWQKVRDIILTKNPICYFCHRFSNEVHHIDSKDELKFYDFDNLVAICSECHKKVNDAYRRGIKPEFIFDEAKVCQE